jgi:hypothetical protein
VKNAPTMHPTWKQRNAKGVVIAPTTSCGSGWAMTQGRHEFTSGVYPNVAFVFRAKKLPMSRRHAEAAADLIASNQLSRLEGVGESDALTSIR